MSNLNLADTWQPADEPPLPPEVRARAAVYHLIWEAYAPFRPVDDYSWPFILAVELFERHWDED